MGNKLRDEDLKLNIIVNGDKGKKELGDLEKSTRELTARNKELRAEKEKLIRAGQQESEQYKAITKEITANNAAINGNKTRMTQLRKEIGITGLTMQQLRAEQTRLKNLLNTSTYGTAQWKKLKTDLNSVETQMAKVNGGGQKMQSILRNLMPAVGITAIIAGITGMGSKIFGVRKEFEKYQAVLANSLGSQRAAAKELNMLSDLAAQTPFQLSELTGGFVKLTNYGLKPSREEMRKYGDVAASVGKTFDQYVEAIADATQFEFERLKEFGIRASKDGDKIKFTFKGITTEVQANSEAVKDYMAGLGDLKGVAGSMEAISKTMGGASSNMADAFDRLMNKWGSGGISQYLVTQMRNITAFMSNLAGKTPTLVEELSKVRTELDKELTILRAGNFTADERATMIRKINTEYQDYLPNLLDEKASLTDIEKYHNLINGHMQARIIYASYEDEIKDILKQQTQALAGNYEIEKKRTELNLGMNPSMADRNPDVLNKIFDQATSINNSIVQNTDKKTAAVKEKYEFMAKSIGMTFSDIQKMISDLGKKTTGAGDGIKLSEKEQKTASDKALEILDQANNKRMAALIKQYEREAWTDERWKMEQMAAELAYLEQKKALLLQFGQSTIQVEEQINQQRASINKETISEELKALYEEFDQDQELITKAVDSTIDAADNTMNQLDQLKDREAQILEQRQQAYLQFGQAYLQFGQAVGQSFGQLMADSEATFGDYLRNTLVMALEAFHQFFLIEKAKAIIQGAGKGPVGIAVAIAKVAAMEIAYQGAKAAILSTGKKKSKSKNYWEGGWTGPGAWDEPKGIVHSDEFVANRFATGNPEVKQFLDVFDYYQRTGQISRLNTRMIMASLPVQKMYVGGYSSKQATSSTTSASQPFAASAPQSIDPDTVDRLIKVLDKLEKKKLVVYTELVKKDLDTLEEIEKNRGL